MVRSHLHRRGIFVGYVDTIGDLVRGGAGALLAGFTVSFPSARSATANRLPRTPRLSLQGRIRFVPALGSRWDCRCRCRPGPASTAAVRRDGGTDLWAAGSAASARLTSTHGINDRD